MITRITENTAESGNKTAKDLMDELVAFLKDDGVGIDKVNYNNKTIYVKTDKDLDEASWQVKHFWRDATRLGISIAKNINVPGLNKILPHPAFVDESIDDAHLFINTGNNFAIYQDCAQHILLGKTRTKREAQKWLKDNGYTKDAEVWIEPIENTTDESCKLVEDGTADIPTINRIPKDVDVVYEYVIRDLLKMKLVGSTYDASYYVGKLNSNQVVLAIVPRSQNPLFYIFSNLPDEELDYLVTMLATDGADYMWDSFVYDNAGTDVSFWEFIQEWQ